MKIDKAKIIRARVGEEDIILTNLIERYAIARKPEDRGKLGKILEEKLSDIETKFSPQVADFYRDKIKEYETRYNRQ